MMTSLDISAKIDFELIRENPLKLRSGKKGRKKKMKGLVRNTAV